MKKRLLLSLFLLLTCTCLVGCFGGKKEESGSDGTTEKNDEVINWTINSEASSIAITEDAANAYNTAIEKYTGFSLAPIAFLASKDNTTYLFLCKETIEGTSTFKMITVTNGEITKSTPFDFTKYAGKDIKGTQTEQLSNGWKVNTENGFADLDNIVFTAFVNATAKLEGFVYTPVALVAKDSKNDEVYAFLCVEQSVNTGEYTLKMVTMEIKSESDSKVTSTAFVNVLDLL